jgi:hypothetical protein
MIYDTGAQSLARVLAHSAVLTHLTLCNNMINKAWTESLAGVLPQCPALVDPDLLYNMIGTTGGDRIRVYFLTREVDSTNTLRGTLR